jgi:hypothetical protein
MSVVCSYYWTYDQSRPLAVLSSEDSLLNTTTTTTAPFVTPLSYKPTNHQPNCALPTTTT